MILALSLYVILFAIAVFGPLRWSIVAYLLLSNIDFPGERDAVGVLNAAKGLILPLILLWRFRAYSGHKKVIIAPIAWILLVIYAGIAGFWSLFPISALKLAGHMTGFLLICFVFLRAAKGGFLTPRIVPALTLGVLSLAALCRIFDPRWSMEIGRFTSFTPAQGFASLLGALFCLALCAESLRTHVRILCCAALAVALIFNGSRIWFIGILIAALGALLVSAVKPWIKICVAGSLIVAAALLFQQTDRVIQLLDRYAASNRIAAAIAASYEGDVHSRGLGTLNFREGIDALAVERIKASSLTELVFGHGTSNGAIITGSLSKGHSHISDPNRLMHNEWLRVLYEWGILGFILWLMFLASIALFAYEGVRRDSRGHAKALLVYLPAFLVALAGENFLAGAGTPMSTGFLLLIGIAAISHRTRRSEPRLSRSVYALQSRDRQGAFSSTVS